MITYKLAKQLKDAGFPQYGDKGNGSSKAQVMCGELFYYPTLSELIEECGDKFAKLVQQGQGLTKEEREIAYKIFETKDIDWIAYSYERMEYGKTPKIAVAKLFIQLNKK